MDLKQTLCDDRYCFTLHFDTSLIDRDIEIQGHRIGKKQNPSVSIISQNFAMDFKTCWCGEPSFFMLLCPFNIQGREPYLYDFVHNQQTFNVDLYSEIYWLISFKLSMMIDTTKFNIFISVWRTVAFIQGHSCIRNQKLSCPFSHKFNYQFG